MDAPSPETIINLLLENETGNKKFNVKISNSSNALLINIIEEESFPKIEYSKDFTLKDLFQNGKFFKVFDDISNILLSLKETFENKKPKIKEGNNYIELTIIPILSALGESVLIIPKKKSDDKEIINNLCEIVKNLSKEIESLKNKVSTLEEKIKNLEEGPKRRITNSNNLIGDIITNEEQYHLICDWINKEKSFKFKLLYKGTKDGDTIEIFHNKCDNQAPTISIIKSTDGQVFGGYTSKSWDKNQKKDVPDPLSFLFNINNKKKYCVSNNKGIMKDYICDFGGNNFHELWIKNYYLSEISYCDNGQGYNFKNYELSGGKNSFKVQELEVYRVEEN
jgi:hypothetical protein